MEKKIISDAISRRLPIYYRHICAMETEGVKTVTSSQLAARVGNTSAQVRQDFFTCGGVESYDVTALKRRLRDITGIDKIQHMVVVGAGNLGRAIISFNDFNKINFFIDAAFDSNLMLGGMQIYGVPILGISGFESYLKTNPVDIVIITTPAEAAEEIFEKAVSCGVKGVWNFAPVDLRSTEGVAVQNMHLSDSLMTLSFRMNEGSFVPRADE